MNRAVAVLWSSWIVLMAGANLATPLYARYADDFGFSSLVLTSVFATYAVVLVPALIVFGRLSDRFGRRPVLLAGLLTACAGLGLFAGAQGVAWLYGARAVQGLAVGMISAAATAGLVELDRGGDRRRAALLAGLAQAGGSAIGPLFAGVVAEWAPDPLRLPFVLALAATAVAAGMTIRMPEPARGEREPWRIEWPRVPPELRSDFARVSVTAAVVWAAVALYLSIVPSYARVSLDTENLALLAVVAALALLASCAAQVVAQRFAGKRRRDQAFGLLLLTAGLGALIAGAPSHSLAVLLCGALAAGIGHGLAFLNAQQELNELAPSERRGEVTAAFVSCIYFLVATAVVGVGILDELFSLTASVAAVAAGLMALALAATAWQWRGPASQAPHLPGVLVRPLQ